MVKVEELKEALRAREILVLEEKKVEQYGGQLLTKKRFYHIVQLIPHNGVQFIVYNCIYVTVADEVPLDLVNKLNLELPLIKVWRHGEEVDTIMFTFYVPITSPEEGAEGLLRFEELLKPAIETVEKWELEWCEKNRRGGR